MTGMPLTRTASLVESVGRRRRVEVSVKRRFYPDPNSGLLKPIDTTPQGARYYSNYYFEVVKHDLHLAFAPRKSGLPFVRIGLPGESAVWYLWFVGWDDHTPRRPIQPELIDHGEGFVEWRLDGDTRMRIEILGHLIRKLIIVERRPEWNRLRFRIGRANALLIDGAAVGMRGLFAFKGEATFGENPVFWFSEPYCWDSAREPLMGKVDYKLTPVTEALWEMALSLDADWLDNATYPVYIDPTIILQPDATEGLDVRLLAVYPDRNEGTDIIIATYNAGTNKQNSLLLFNLTSIPSNSIINSAVLYLTIYGGYSSYPHRVRVGRTLEYWDEMQATWDNRLTGTPWTTPGGDYEGTYADEGGKVYGDCSLETASLVQLWVNGTYSNYGYHLRDDEVGHNGGVFCSSDHSDLTKHPKLTIDYTEGGGVFIPAKLGSIAGKGSISPLASA